MGHPWITGLILRKSLFIFFILTFASCENLLDLNPSDSLSDAYFWANESCVQGYVDRAYHLLGGYYASRITPPRPLSWGHFRGEACDEAYAHIPWGGGQDLTNGNLSPATKSTIGGWTYFYPLLQHINVFFDNYEKGRFDVGEDKLTVWLAEMHLLRAWYHNQMIKCYGGIIIANKPFKHEDPVDQVRASYDECVAFILDEINQALPGLPVESVAGRLTYGVGLGLKSQVLLHAASPLHNPTNDLAKWQAAADAAEAVINLPQYSLYFPTTKYIDVLYHMPGEGNTEIMLAKYMHGDSLVHFFNYSSTLFGPPSWGGWGLAEPIQALVDDFQMADGTIYDRAVHGATPYQGREKRFYANILYDGAEYSSTLPRFSPAIGIKVETGRYKYIDTASGDTLTRYGYDGWGFPHPRTYSRTGYYCHKYVKDDVTTKFQVGDVSQCVLMRLSEFYLNYAECLVKLGRGAEARDYLLPIRRRVGLPDESLPAEVTMDEVMYERRVELAFEGQRFFDVRRWKILDQTFKDAYRVFVANNLTVDPPIATYTYAVLQIRTYHEKLYYMPIPAKEIEINPLLEQNTGY